MQKTFLKFIVFELVERIVRFRLLLDECGDALLLGSPELYRSLKREADQLETDILSHRTLLNRFFTEKAAPSGKQEPLGLGSGFSDIYTRLKTLSQVLTHIKTLELAPETHLFLRDVLPVELLCDLGKHAGEQSVFLVGEGQTDLCRGDLLDNVLIGSLSVLQKNNPLGWMGLTQPYSGYLLENASSLEALKLELRKTDKKKGASQWNESLIDNLLGHAINLRLLGPAYYFHMLSEAVFAETIAPQADQTFLNRFEPSLFYGLNHQNFTHKSLVILHEACERSKSTSDKAGSEMPVALPEEVLANVFRAVEKLVPAKYAFQEKQMDCALQLQSRLRQGTLLSSTPHYPVEEVAENLNQTRDKKDFSIYTPLAMMTEYPHTPREIVNAGWLHKIERSPVWLYAILNEDREEGFEKVASLLSDQDHLLRKSIEVSEVHRVLLCTP